MTAAPVPQINTAERKAKLTRLRTRLKWAVGAYHLLAGSGERLEYATFDGLKPLELKRWTDAVIDNLRRLESWHYHFFLVNLCVSASDDNRKPINEGRFTAAVVYEPAVSIYIDTYQVEPADAWKLLDQAVDAAVRLWILKEEADGSRRSEA